MEKVSVHIEADVNPTESKEKVEQAIENLFGHIETHTEPGYGGSSKIHARSSDIDALTRLRTLLRREHIRAAARTILVAGIDRNSTSFCLNKQVAYAGHLSFCQREAESPLGPIQVKIECENPRRLIDWLTSENV